MIMQVGDILEMKKKHPCGDCHFIVLRVGSDIKVRCNSCQHEITMPRVKLEKGIKRIVTPDNQERN